MPLVISRFFVLSAAICIGACAHAEKPAPGAAEGQASTTVSGADSGKLFDCFATLHGRNTETLAWVLPLDGAEGYFVTTELHYEPIRKYSGHEVVIFDRKGAAYYWMPGALPDAMGFVPEGVYVIDAELPGGQGKAVRLRLEKRYPTAFVLLEQGAALASADDVQRPPPQTLDHEIFVAELHELAHQSLGFLAQELRSAALRSLATERLADGAIVAACEKLSPRLDTLLERIADELGTTAIPDTP